MRNGPPARWSGKFICKAITRIAPKLDAFLDRYTALLDTKTSAHLRRFHLAWNGFETLTAHCIDDWLESLSELSQHAQEWQKNLSKQQDLCSALVYFYQSKAIMRG